MMSRDRVRFVVPFASHEIARLLRDTLGVEYVYGAENVIICRPSQFARFLIERNNRGITNDFKGLRPELFIPNTPPIPTEVILDASRNPALTTGIHYASK